MAVAAVAAVVGHSRPDSVQVLQSPLSFQPQQQPGCTEPPALLCSVPELLSALQCAACRNH